MKLTTTNRQAVDNGAPYGIFVFRCSDGEVLGDGDGNIMNIFGMRADGRKHAAAIREAAAHYGFTDGTVEFWPGQRQIDDEELERQRFRQSIGLTPDPLDYGALMDEMEAKRNGRA
jgi:hypothetical protein